MVIDVETFVGQEWRTLFVNSEDPFWFGLHEDRIVFWTQGGSVESNSIEAQKPVHIICDGIRENGKIRVSIYIDGQLDVTDLIPPFPANPLGSETTFGGSASGDNFYVGSIDCLKIYDRVLLQEEIEELLDPCKCGVTPANEFNIRNQKITIFPCPNLGIFTLQFKKEIPHPFSISVFNILGDKVYSQKLKNGSTSVVINIDMSDQINGIYFLTIQDESGRVNKKSKIFNPIEKDVIKGLK